MGVWNDLCWCFGGVVDVGEVVVCFEVELRLLGCLDVLFYVGVFVVVECFVFVVVVFCVGGGRCVVRLGRGRDVGVVVVAEDVDAEQVDDLGEDALVG